MTTKDDYGGTSLTEGAGVSVSVPAPDRDVKGWPGGESIMPRKLKVYRWQGFRIECPAAPNGSKQTVEIMAATSMAEVHRIVGGPKQRRFNLGETRNAEAVQIAMSEPGVVFWRPIDSRDGYIREQP